MKKYALCFVFGLSACLLTGQNSGALSNPSAADSVAVELVKQIKSCQRALVRLSYTKTDCFTSADLENFIAIYAQKIPIILPADQLAPLARRVRALPETEWQPIKTIALKTYRPTWLEQNEVNENGQTEAGQIAEKMVAEFIVDWLESLGRSH